MPDDDPRRNPFEGVTDYFSELNRLRQTGIHGRDPGHEGRERTHASAWVPTTDIFARDGDLVVHVELAGVSPDDVGISFAHGDLTVAGSRRSEAGGDASFYVRERFYGEFRRTITLPEGVGATDIGAVFDNGLVEITVRGAVASGETSRIDVQRRSDGPTRRALG
jgi:HSP20 family protein